MTDIIRDISSDDDDKEDENTITFGHISLDGYLDEGDSSYECEHCGALFWINERVKRSSTPENPVFSLCCCNGKSNIRAYNNMFAFTSMGGKVNHSLNTNGAGPYTYVLSGQNYHHIGSLLPEEGAPPVYSQLYICDTENEIANRISAVSHHGQAAHLNKDVVHVIKECLDEHNNLVKKYRHAYEILKRDKHADVKICLIRQSDSAKCYNLPASSEIAALVVGDFDRTYHKRDIIVGKKDGRLKRIDELHKSYLPLQYPLLFYFGNNGYDSEMKHAEHTLQKTKKKKTLSIREYLAYRLMERRTEESVILYARRLLQQFIVDGYTMVEADRLKFLRDHQKELRVDLYKGLSDAITRGETDPSMIGKRVILPSSFTGGARYMVNNFQDAMAICKFTGYPDIFLTFTCNPAWPEVRRYCERRNLSPSDCPTILSRIFKMKLDALMRVIKEQKIFGTIRAEIYTIEFQKRGLPHAHIILFIDPRDKPKTPGDIDKIISVEIPDERNDPELYELVSNYMMHGPCGSSNKKSPCMKDGKCSKYFPKKFVDHTVVDEDGYPTYRRRRDGHTIVKKGVTLDNRYVVPYNANLLRLFRGHINVEKTNQSQAIKYLFKYISKGNDRVVAGIYKTGNASDSEMTFDEITHYLNCRYVSPCEAAWRIFAFDIHHRYPSVERLSFHLPMEQAIYYSYAQPVSSIMDKPTVRQSMFLAWMSLNQSQSFARTLTYIQIPQFYTFDKKLKIWKPRQRGFAIGRLAHSSPSQGETYYLRVLLTKVRGPKSYEEIRTVNDIIYPTFRAACYALGLLQDDQEYIDAIKEASFWATGHYLRRFFVSMLLCNCLSQPMSVWEKTKEYIYEDMLYVPRAQQQLTGLKFSDKDKEEASLVAIEKLLQRNGKSLLDYPSMPKPTTEVVVDTRNRMIIQELSFDQEECHTQSQRLRNMLTDEQRHIYHSILKAMDDSNGGFFFVHGFGGTGKTFLWNALTKAVKSKGEIVINVASSGIAATLLPYGRTAHSRFAIPIDITEVSMCNITQNSSLGNLIKATKLIIWDEAPMVRRYCVEAVDRTFRDIMKCDKPFGGKCVVMGGDFRQILPVVPKGGRADVVDSSINSSELWNHCKLFNLTKNMRLSTTECPIQQTKIHQFSKWLLDVGEGKLGLPHDGITDITIPEEILIKCSDDPIASIVTATFPSLRENIMSSNYLMNRAILAPTIEVVEQINDYMCSMLDGDCVEYYSSDSVSATEQDSSFTELYTTEFMNTINCSGMPPHKLSLKIGCPIMLMRNIDQASGLCNGTRLRTTFLGKHFIKAVALNGSNIGEEVLIHRMDMNPSETSLPFTMTRRQFPIIPSFAMTINKNQGQSMTNVGLFLPRPVFSHGQLYVALSRVKSIDGLKILILDHDCKPTNTTTNVVYREIFQNVPSV
ncbi:uncharacterized protein LOC114759678 [Neltuma alba]|uniref:uncharacterized protein LOC114759678 n=1 Tax=Neltuma alba TaxID=207710 RepID=UPI0010A2E642|nr:uncharacterized protein LOC114759678 [Prosopis alba]